MLAQAQVRFPPRRPLLPPITRDVQHGGRGAVEESRTGAQGSRPHGACSQVAGDAHAWAQTSLEGQAARTPAESGEGAARSAYSEAGRRGLATSSTAVRAQAIADAASLVVPCTRDVQGRYGKGPPHRRGRHRVERYGRGWKSQYGATPPGEGGRDHLGNRASERHPRRRRLSDSPRRSRYGGVQGGQERGDGCGKRTSNNRRVHWRKHTTHEALAKAAGERQDRNPLVQGRLQLRGERPPWAAAASLPLLQRAGGHRAWRLGGRPAFLGHTFRRCSARSQPSGPAPSAAESRPQRTLRRGRAPAGAEQSQPQSKPAARSASAAPGLDITVLLAASAASAGPQRQQRRLGGKRRGGGRPLNGNHVSLADGSAVPRPTFAAGEAVRAREAHTAARQRSEDISPLTARGGFPRLGSTHGALPDWQVPQTFDTSADSGYYRGRQSGPGQFHTKWAVEQRNGPQSADGAHARKEAQAREENDEHSKLTQMLNHSVIRMLAPLILLSCS